MKNLKRTIIFTAVLLTVNCILPTGILAQGPGFDEDVDDVPVPFDGGVTLVAAAAVGYGIKKIRERKNNK